MQDPGLDLLSQQTMARPLPKSLFRSLRSDYCGCLGLCSYALQSRSAPWLKGPWKPRTPPLLTLQKRPLELRGFPFPGKGRGEGRIEMISAAPGLPLPRQDTFSSQQWLLGKGPSSASWLSPPGRGIPFKQWWSALFSEDSKPSSLKITLRSEVPCLSSSQKSCPVNEVPVLQKHILSLSLD